MSLQKIKDFFFFEKTKKNIFYYLSLLLASSFIFQPTNLRVFGYSITLLLMVLFSFLSFFNIRKIWHIKKNIIIYPILIYLIINYFFIQDKRVLSILICLGFYLYSTSQSLNYFQIQNILKVFYLVLVLLLVIAWYNFINFFFYNSSLDFLYIAHYPFLSISYAVGARGYSSFYFLLGCIFSYYFFLKFQGINKFINYFIFLFFCFSVILTQSVSAYLILFFLLVFYFKLYLLLFLSIFMHLLFFLIDIFFGIDFIAYRLSGFFNYSSSFAERFNIIKEAFVRFIYNPWGTGPYDVINEKWTHSENTYLDVVLNYGIYGIFFLYVLFIYIIKNLKFLDNNSEIKFINSLLYLTLFFAFFHSTSNFYVIYFIIVLIIKMYKNKRNHRAI